MNITFVTSTLTSGGSERVMSLLANNFVERGHQVTIILLRQPIVFYDIHKSVNIVFAEDFSHNMMGKIVWLRKFIATSNTDVVIPFMTSVYCTTIFALLGLNIPIISSERIDPRFSSLPRRIMRWMLLRYTTHLVVQTQDIKNFYSKRIQRKCTIIANPVSESVFNINHDVPKLKRIISVGRLYEQKNQRMMINAFADISSKYPDYSLIIYGEGPLRETLTKQIAELNLQQRVTLAGRSNNIIDELQKSEIFALSSDYEGMSNALLEAVCVGLPIVTTRVSGVDDMLIDGKNAYITTRGSQREFAAALDKILSNEDTRKVFAKNNRNQALDYRLNSIVSKWEQLITSIINREYDA